jgi:hypothetical protein
MTTKIPVELSSTPGISDSSNATAITIDSSENSTFAGNVKSPRYILDGTDSATTRYIFTDNTNTGDGRLIIQSGGGSAGYGGAVNLYSHAHASKPGDVVAGISSSSSGAFRVNTSGIDNGSDVIRVDSDGLKFGSDTAAANALDDYEEGTFNPGASISGASGSIAYNSTNDHLNYTKIGDMVHVQGSLQIASNSANGGRLNITGLPFTAASLDGLGGQTIFHVQISGGTGSQESGYLASLAEGATQLQVQKYTGITATNDSAVTMAADSFLLISGQYKAA